VQLSMKYLTRLAVLILTGITFCFLAQTVRSTAADTITYPESIRQIATTNPQFASDASPAMVRSELTQAEAEATLEFSVALKMRDLDGLQKRIGQGEKITLDEMTAKYFPTATDYKTVADWLTSQGFAVKSSDKYNLSVFASGSVAQIEQALKTKFGRVKFAGKEYSSALISPSLSAAIAGPVLGINGLQPHLYPKRNITFVPRQVQKLIDNQPPYTIGEIATAYHANGLNVNGGSQKIGIVIDTFPLASDLTAFWQGNGIAQSLNNIEEVQVVSGTLPSPSGEETLDVEWSSGMASGAKIRVYATTDLSFVHLDQAYQTIINELPAQPTLHQVSLSYGLGEEYMPTGQMQTDDQYFAALAGAGISVFVSSGDGGSTPGPGSAGDNSGPVQVESPASDPNVTAVGGTSLYLNASTGSVSSESAWFYGGGGVSQFFARPSWQIGSGVPSGGTRLVPDVALAADPNTGAYLILNGELTTVGGTSWSAPTWAGFSAMINQARANAGLSSSGILGPKIYPLNGTSTFRDITTGSNGFNGLYNAGPGYDLCTGLGVPRLGNLIQALTTGKFLASIGPDFNGDGKTDILWRNTLTGDTWIWLMNGNSIAASGRVAIVDLSWIIVGVGNFDGRGIRDIVWYNAALGKIAIWTMNGFTATGSYEFQAPVGAPGQWAVVGIADFDHTGLSDILWQDSSSGALYMWKTVSPLSFTTIGIGTVDPTWRVVGAADVEGSGLPDIIWHNSVTGGVYIWQLRNDQVSRSVFMGQYSLSWQIDGFGDFSGDGNQDILWRNNSTGQVCVWLMDGFSVFAQWFPGAPSLTWNVAGTPDLNGDGKNDILWTNPSAGLITSWFGTATYLSQPPPFASFGSGWAVAPSQ
jgi:kumamolisin